jgi:hypothetical protein
MVKMVLFPKDVIEIYKEVEDGAKCGLDLHQRPKKCMVLQETVMGDFQIESSKENMEEFGQTAQDEAIAILPVNSNISPNSKLLIETYDGFWQVVGTPQVWNTLIPHIEVKLIKER